MPFALPAPVTKLSNVGVDVVGFSHGFPNGIGGVSIDNPSLSWLNVNTVPGGIYIPPLTLGWASPLAVPKDSIDVRFVEAPFGATASNLLGSPIAVTIYPADEYGSSGLAYNAGTPVFQPAVSPTFAQAAIFTSVLPNTVGNTPLLIAPNPGFRYRIYTAVLALFASSTSNPYGLFMNASVRDTLNYIPLAVSYDQPFASASLSYGLPFGSAQAISVDHIANFASCVATIYIYYSTEPG